MKRHLKILATCLLINVVAAPLMAQSPYIEWTEKSLILQYDVRPEYVGSDYSYIAVTKLCGGIDTIDLNTQIWRGRRNVKKYKRALLFDKQMVPTSYMSLKADTAHIIKTELAYVDYPWLRERPLSLLLQSEREGCCRIESMKDTVLKRFVYVPPFVPVLSPVKEVKGIAPELESKHKLLSHISKFNPDVLAQDQYRSHRGLYVYFPVSSIVLDGSFRGNNGVLQEVIQTTREVLADSASMVKKILIAGLASPDGPSKKNNWLAEHRALALKTYIKDSIPQLDDDLFELINCGEGWWALRDLIAQSDMKERDEVLKLIDEVTDEPKRELELRTMHKGWTYKYIKEELLKEQRNSGYLAIYYDVVVDYAAQKINKAVSLMGEKKYNEALELLKEVETDSRSHNALGVAYMYNNERTEARKYLKKASDKGSTDANYNLNMVEQIERAEKSLLELE